MYKCYISSGRINIKGCVIQCLAERNLGTGHRQNAISPPQASFVKLPNLLLGRVMASLAERRNVYLLKIGAKSFGYGSQDISKDTESNLGPFAGF